MHYVSLIVEFLRGRPAIVFWAAALSQAFLWVVVPSLFFSSPPGDVATLLAIGHEFRLGSYLGPPLAFWLGEVAFRLLGVFGVYLLAQACVVVALWAVFTLGRSIVGTRHAVLAILLMVGVLAFTVPTPEFGPAVLAMPLWALALLHYWRALGEDARGYWFLVAVDLGLLLLTSYAGVLLVVLFAIFTPLTTRGRDAFRHAEPWIALLLLALVIFPHAAWLFYSFALVRDAFLESTRGSEWPPVALFAVALIASHIGALTMMLLASGWRLRRDDRAPEIDRPPADGAGKLYVYFFAIVPALVVLAVAAASGRLGGFDRVTPFVLLTALAVLVAAGDRVHLYRERKVSVTWLALLIGPPLIVAASVVVVPWTVAADLETGQPAGAMGRFFADNFQRRFNRPLTYIAGDQRLAARIALASPSRPHLFNGERPERTPWARTEDLRINGGLLVWPATDTAGTPPAAIRAMFPEIVPELPRAFARPIQGRLPLIRIGWAIVRPQGAPQGR